jgi:hypothetical protein
MESPDREGVPEYERIGKPELFADRADFVLVEIPERLDDESFFDERLNAFDAIVVRLMTCEFFVPPDSMMSG